MIVVGLGSNLGSREAFLRAAEHLLATSRIVQVSARSRLYVTPPLGPPQPDYLNAALRLEHGEVSPREVLTLTQAIEAALGRERKERWGPRVIDLDLLYWSGGAVREPTLEIPHPGLVERAFAIAPLLDVAPELSKRYRCERPAERLWSSLSSPPDDRLDRRAFETSARLGGPPDAPRVEAFSDQLPSEGPAWVALERWDDEVRRGVVLR